MNRRGFLSGILKAAAGFAVLPPATTYSRIWRATRPTPLGYTSILLPDVNHFGELTFIGNTNGWYHQLKACGAMMESVQTPEEKAFYDCIFSNRRIPHEMV